MFIYYIAFMPKYEVLLICFLLVSEFSSPSLSCGTTWHAAGLIGQLRSTSVETKLCGYGCELYSKLEEETGLGTGELAIVNI